MGNISCNCNPWRIDYSDIFNNITAPVRTANEFIPKKIIRNKATTVVLWKDGTKTLVRCEEGKEYDVYEAFTAALAKKIFQNNTKLKKLIKEKFTEQKPRRRA